MMKTESLIFKTGTLVKNKMKKTNNIKQEVTGFCIIGGIIKVRKRKKSNNCQKRTKLMKETSEHVGAAAHLSGRAVQGFLDRGELRADELLLTQLLFGLLQVLARLLQPETSNHIYSSTALTVQ